MFSLVSMLKKNLTRLPTSYQLAEHVMGVQCLLEQYLVGNEDEQQVQVAREKDTQEQDVVGEDQLE